MMSLRISNVLFSLALALYLGGLLTLGAVVAPALAQTVRQDHILYPALPQGLDVAPQTIGQLFGPALYRFLPLEMTCAGIMVIALGIETLQRRSASLKARSILMLIILALLGYDAFALTPKVWQTRDAWRQAAAADIAAAHGPLEAEFATLHKRSELLGQAKVWTLAALLAVTAWSQAPAQRKKL